MNERVFKVLEFNKVKARIQTYAACSLGKGLLESLGPFPELALAEQELASVDECLRALYRQGSLPFGGITDIRSFLRKAEIGGVLGGPDLNAIADFIAGGRRVRQSIDVAVEALNLVHLAELAADLFDARQTEQEIRQTIADDGTVLDHASPELRKLRNERRQVEARVRQVLEQMLRTHQKYLQDPVIAMRGSSFCLPVRIEYKNLVPGILHDYSSSGATVFIEPQGVVEANLRVRELVLEEEREIERILQRVSGVVATVANELTNNAAILAQFDAWFAKAAHAKANRCERPTLRADKVWNLKRARHPLLERESAVPIDLLLGESYQMIIVTGPNTGGKTVALKTLGLLTVMAMCGCYIPTEQPSEVGWCDDIFVDIGDEQSIEQSLSTFSSHMRTIVQMLSQVSHQSLVLLDELGAGTDPTEGAALAIAILNQLNRLGASVMATTHYAELKGYAFNEPNVINASVEFDVETLRPTYRLQIGVPGRSNALAIASRLGLTPDIIEQARSYVHTNDVRVEDLIAKMEQARREAEQARNDAQEARAQATQLREEWEEKWQTLEAEMERQRAKAVAEAQDVLRKAQSEAERVIAELRRRQRSGGAKDHELVELRKALESALPSEGRKRKPGRLKAQDVQVGAIVKVVSLGQKGEVLEVMDGGEATVQLGLLRMKVKLTDLEVLQNEAPQKVSVSSRRGLPNDMKLELDIRGETVDDAIPQIDKYLDDAVVNGLPRVSIIHGKGTGALRDGVRRYLTKHPQVSSWAPGGPGDGGDGVTIVAIKG